MNPFGSTLRAAFLVGALLAAATAQTEEAAAPAPGPERPSPSRFDFPAALQSPRSPEARLPVDGTAPAASGNAPLALPPSPLPEPPAPAAEDDLPDASSGADSDAVSLERTDDGGAGITGSGWTSAAALCVVLILILGTARLFRRHVARAAGILPEEAVEVLGRRPIDAKHTVHLLRVGTKLLMVGSSAGGLHALGEVADQAEADRLAGLCRQARPNSASASFRKVLEGYETSADDDADDAAGHRIG